MSKTVLESVDSTDLDVENPMLRFDELDSDLYDRISYLDLVSRHREERFRKLEQLRRNRDDLERPSKLYVPACRPKGHHHHQQQLQRSSAVDEPALPSKWKSREIRRLEQAIRTDYARLQSLLAGSDSDEKKKEYGNNVYSSGSTENECSSGSYSDDYDMRARAVNRKECIVVDQKLSNKRLTARRVSAEPSTQHHTNNNSILSGNVSGLPSSLSENTIVGNSGSACESGDNCGGCAEAKLNGGAVASPSRSLSSTSLLRAADGSSPSLRSPAGRFKDSANCNQQQVTVVSIAVPPVMDVHIRHIWSEAIDISEIRNIEDQAEFRVLRSQLGIDEISPETMTHYYVKGHMDSYDQPAICYPRYRGPATRSRVPTGLKIIRRCGDKLEKENYPEPDDSGKTRFSGIFGYQMITPSDNRVVLTTNERDALAVYDSTNGIPALTLPNGERLDQSVMPYLEDFELIYLWFPQVHEVYARDYASYLNASRCYIVTKAERPVELLRDNRAKEILHGIQEAVRVRYRGFRSLTDMREEVRNEIVQSRSRLSGIAQWKRYELLNQYLRGFRPGELTVLTGGTGYGKTTFLCEYSMDLYTQGVRTLFSSFEMPEEKILKWMIVQFSAPSHVRSLARSRTHQNGMKLPLHRVDHHTSVELWLDRFERTHSDLIIMKTDEFRNKTVKEIAEAIKEQVIAGGAQHVVIDNLQFLVGLATLGNDALSAQDKLNLQDRFVCMLRRIANDYGAHITLVVHPRKTSELDDLELQNIGGSTRIVQEADNVLAIQRRRDDIDRRRFHKFLYILKNRFGGRRVETDQIEMIFQSSTYTHQLVEVPPPAQASTTPGVSR